MGRWFQTITDIKSEENLELLRRRPYGVIEVVGTELSAIHLRPYPKIVSIAEASWADGWGKNRNQLKRVQLYYNQPLGSRNFLTLKYIVSTLHTKTITLAMAVSVLDWIAMLKQSDAIVTEVSNARLSPRVMDRYGWERHLESSRRPHYIKRFYGEYPESFLFLDFKARVPRKKSESNSSKPVETLPTHTPHLPAPKPTQKSTPKPRALFPSTDTLNSSIPTSHVDYNG